MRLKMKLKIKTHVDNPTQALKVALKILEDAKARVHEALSDASNRGGFALGAPLLVGDEFGRLTLVYANDPPAPGSDS